MSYAIHNGKKLYYPSRNAEWVAKKMSNRRMEQDRRSPHSCFLEKFRLPGDDEVFIDVEDVELEVLMGAKEVLKRGGVRLAVCTYHKETDEKEIYSYLAEL